ncbi:M10 family metallopeptidase C-terminal domain-containing protein [Lentibacter sp.]|uniref:M10 family metallopeptidase C-terminal domain-containing protein n=1 Tax=Lentibacter sp. TaxID=2024994 RepID=UPI003F69F14C
MSYNPARQTAPFALNGKQTFRLKTLDSWQLNTVWAFPLLTACGGGSSDTSGTNHSIGSLPSGYTPPSSPYVTPTAPDPHANTLFEAEVPPYWVAALGNSNYDQLDTFYKSFDNKVGFAFPTTAPDYLTDTDKAGWAAASPAVQAAYRDIFSDLETLFNVSFEEVTDTSAFNVVSISQNTQTDTSGYAFFPNETDPIGSDVFISNEYDNPTSSSSGTNFDYELLLHELSHAFGFKHPFEADGTATETLSDREDNSNWTVATYTQVPSAYNGAYRDLDLMTFAGLFGINPSYKAGDTTYTFSNSTSVFILDGAGHDTISAAAESAAAYIDLRPEMHSHLGSKSEFITDARQLTISAGSEIEVAIGGSGNDYLVGNTLDNELRGAAGNDKIFAGEGKDTVQGGAGSDTIDLSEATSKTDTLVFESRPAGNGADTVYAFDQGAGGDVISFSSMASASLLAVVSAANVPVANVSGAILRLVSDGLDSVAALSTALSEGGSFANLQISSGSEILALTAASQATGQDQSLFHIANDGAGLTVHLLASFAGNYLDIDTWHGDNFI